MAIYDKNHSKYVKATYLKSGDKGIVKIKSTKNLCLEKYTDVPFLGRFTIRDENSTIGYGIVRKYKPAFEF
jgi:translation elongation factor EF-1alpha